MRDRLRRRFWVETALALVSGVVCLLTILWHNWLEIAFNVDPDHSSGLLEWLIVFILLAVTVTSATVARYEWHRLVARTV